MRVVTRIGPNLRDALQRRLSSLKKEVIEEDQNKLLNCNETEYINYLVEKNLISVLILDLENKYVSNREEMIPAELFPRAFDVRSGKSYKKQAIVYHIPFSGNIRLMDFVSFEQIPGAYHASICGNEICVEIINWRDNREEIEKFAEQAITCVSGRIMGVVAEIKKWNNGLKPYAIEIFKSRKEEILTQLNLLYSLEVPVKKVDNVPSTFSIPITKRKPILKKPVSSDLPYKPEPALDSSVYEAILKICNDMGTEMERHPSVYEGKKEETLRDHFIMQLAPHFESVSGETFNKSGKTDILIRHEGVNVFVAECKFWKGIKVHHKTINQLLRNLTWRDSKAAILYFVKNKKLNPVFEIIDLKTSNHPCFVKYIGRNSDSWFNFHFHLLKDETRGVDVAILCFHFPNRFKS